jgi:hypothetical protein
VHRGSAAYALAYRSIDHRTLRSVCEFVIRPALPPNHREHAPSGGFDTPIKGFAETTLWLQQRRYLADYDPHPRFVTADAVTAIEFARLALRQFRDASAEQRRSLLWLLLFRPR